MLRMLVSRCFWRMRGFRFGADKFGEVVALVLGKSLVTGAGFFLPTILDCGNRLGDVLLHYLQLGERQYLEIESSGWCGPCPGFPGIDNPSRWGPGFPGRRGQG
jgi:hypothetical protein